MPASTCESWKLSTPSRNGMSSRSGKSSNPTPAQALLELGLGSLAALGWKICEACQAQLHCLELGLLAQGLEGPGQGSGLAQDWAVDSAKTSGPCPCNQCNPSPAFQADSGSLAKPFQSTVFPAWAG
mmetsp:Transcript_30301/g.71325  ORF Transcript_30301/g.71325 Transcript_30301/m.71325 type:complete len:127 (+) Transcript_30301:348-728(+)